MPDTRKTSLAAVGTDAVLNHQVTTFDVYLKKRGFPSEQINSLCNFAFITADSNKKISQKGPSDYFATIVPNENRAEILESNLLPANKDVYEKNDLAQFLILRSQKVLEFLDKQLI